MIELKNSQLLEKLLNDAKKMKIGKEGALTAERFFIASIDYVLSRAPIKENEEEKALVALLQNNIANIQDFRDYLIKFVASQEKVSINESLYIQNKLFELRHLTDESVNVVTPAMLVQSILKHPTGTIANYFNGQHGKVKTQKIYPISLVKFWTGFSERMNLMTERLCHRIPAQKRK